MMRRGGRGSNLQAPWRGHDDAIPISALYFQRGWAVGNYVKVVRLVACSIAISILIWRLRRGHLPGPHLLGHNPGSRNSGFVFPLYQNYQQYANGSHVVGGHERWWGSRVGNCRRIRSENPVFELRGSHRQDDPETEFYIEMKLGDPPAKPFYFHVDTGSGKTWVHCSLDGSTMFASTGPNGLFVSEEDSIVKCTGETASFCRALQSKVECEEVDDYKCMFSVKYGDGSDYAGVVIKESITIPMQDKTERDVFVLLGCVLNKRATSEVIPLLSDGVVGLGKCEGSLIDQLSTSKIISQNVLGVCLAKELPRNRLRPAATVGYISLGMDFDEKFDQSKSTWAKLVGPETSCDYIAKLLSISIGNIRITVGLQSLDSANAGMALGFDTGSDSTFLRKEVYVHVLKALETLTTNQKYFRVQDRQDYLPSDQRVCWEYRGNNREHDGNPSEKALPFHDFPPIKFGFEGITTTEIPKLQHTLQYLIIQPENYLIWDVDRKKLCVNIVQEHSVGRSDLGGEQAHSLVLEYKYCWRGTDTFKRVHMMREHLFVFDIENRRVRWKPSSECEL